jgi:hypothetical protein
MYAVSATGPLQTIVDSLAADIRRFKVLGAAPGSYVLAS